MRALTGIMIGSFLALLIFSLQGCAMITIDRERKDGKEIACSQTAYAMFISLNEIGISGCGGSTAAQGLKGDTESMTAVVSAITSAAIKAAVPVP